MDTIDPVPIRLEQIFSERYLAAYTAEEKASHAEELARLSPDTPYSVDARELETPGGVHVTIVGYDVHSLFTIVTGVLSATGMNIVSGSVHTGRTAGTPQRLIIDTFVGRLRDGVPYAQWCETFETKFGAVYRYLRDDTEASREHARRLITEEVAAAVSLHAPSSSGALMPVTIEIDGTCTEFTRISVVAEDTPFFLYSLSVALAIRQISIENVQIETRGAVIHDTFDLVDRSGRAITHAPLLDRIKLSILFTKQFTFFLDRAPDPYNAIVRFEQLVQDITDETDGTAVRDVLVNPVLQKELAVLLGTSSFIWEDFIRLQHENLIPLLGSIEAERRLSLDEVEIEGELTRRLQSTSSVDEKIEVLNAFKDRESFLIDLDHILVENQDFYFLSRRLTALADAVVRAAARIAYDSHVQSFGTPRTAAGLPVDWAVFGLGKLGGSALGYASDIELLFVYGDAGETDGSIDGNHKIANRDFFDRMWRAATMMIHARREGIFRVDLRLRPHGLDGPPACRLESFIEYYRAGGPAHSVERLALVRLRHIAGDGTFGRRVVRVRDELLYSGDAIRIPEVRELRLSQIASKTEPDRVNAKFSPGALVDLEYNVQILQITHGKEHESLRTPGIHDALRGLSEIGTIVPSETESMIDAYRFLRRVINGLRMLRGNAEDLFLPEFDTLEYRHLARRSGYEDSPGLSASQKLRVEFETYTAWIRTFVERHLGRDAIPGKRTVSVADLVLSDATPADDAASTIAGAGFVDPDRAIVNIRSLAAGTVVDLFARLMVLAWDELRTCADPDMALNNWEQYVRRIDDRAAHYSKLLSQPRRLELLFTIFASSQFLSDTVIRDPAIYSWITDPVVVAGERGYDELYTELSRVSGETENRTEWLNAIRRFRKREIVRIGTRDICLGVEMRTIVSEITAVARAILQAALDRVWAEIPDQAHQAERFCLLAFGKLGAGELNYSSDIDIVAMYRPEGENKSDAEQMLYTRVLKTVVRDLTDFTIEGRAYRVDLRLRPYGAAGGTVFSLPAITAYYTRDASLWEYQALIKLAPVAGAFDVGTEFLGAVQTEFLARAEPAQIRASIKEMREVAIQHYLRPNAGPDVKNGEGGIRDIEFLVQGLQFLLAPTHLDVLIGNTLDAISRLEEAGALTRDVAAEIATDYEFLRRVEHFLQLYDDKQRHALPTVEEDREKLARCVFGRDAAGFYSHLETVTARTRRRFREFLDGAAHFSTERDVPTD